VSAAAQGSRIIARLAIVIAAAAAVVVASVPSIASARVAKKARAHETTFVTIGPIKVKGGWTATISDAACGSKAAGDFSVSFAKGGRVDYAIHDYTSTAIPECRVSRGLSSASVSVRWAHVLHLSAKLRNPGKLRKGGRAPVGCTGAPGESRTSVAEGTVDIAIHPKAWGKVAARRVPAFLDTSGTLTCKPPKATNAYEFDANFTNPSAFVLASENTDGKDANVSIANETPDSPATHVTGTSFIQLGKKGVTSVSAGQATINALKGFTTGSLSFAANPACTSSPNAWSGTLNGSLTVNDPVFGSYTLNGSSAQSPTLGLNAASPGDCDGPNYQPLTAAVDNACSSQPSPCSVQYGTNAVTFNDGTDAGSNTIQSETINFGDGSPVATITPGSSVMHTYASPNDYTATITVTYSNGQVGAGPQTATASTPVDITA
jgi:hypothetical protein